MDRMKRHIWIDVFRGIAICAVVVDHTFYTFYDFRHPFLWVHMFFSVIFFVYLSGAANTLSVSGKQMTVTRAVYFFLKRFIFLFFPYAFATGAVLFFTGSETQNVQSYGMHVRNFSAQPTYYYVNLLLQLYVAFPILYIIHTKLTSVWMRVLFSVSLYFFSSTVLGLHYPPWPFNPAGRVMGSTYLFVFYLGMETVSLPNRVWKFTFLPAIALFAYTEWKMLSGMDIFIQSIKNADNVILLVWSLSLLVILRSVVRYLPGVLLRMFSFLGVHSLSIYLFHFLILTLMEKHVIHTPLITYYAMIVSVILPVTLALLYARTYRIVWAWIHHQQS